MRQTATRHYAMQSIQDRKRCTTSQLDRQSTFGEREWINKRRITQLTGMDQQRWSSLTSPRRFGWCTTAPCWRHVPEHLRPASDDEKFILTDFIADILETKKLLDEKDIRGYIILEDKPPLEDLLPRDPQPEGPEPPIPKYRLTGKTDHGW